MVYIQKAVAEEIPGDAIILTENEALDMIQANIKKKSFSEVWPLSASCQLLAFSTAYSSLTLLARYRRQLKLLNFGLYIINMPLTCIPAYGTFFAHRLNIQKHIKLQDECSVCLQTRSAVHQTFFATLIPTMVGSILSLRYAHSWTTYTLPPRFPITQFFPLFWKDIIKLNKPHSTLISGIFVGNVILAMVLVKLQEDTMARIQEETKKEEYEKARRMYRQEKMRRNNNM